MAAGRSTPVTEPFGNGSRAAGDGARAVDIHARGRTLSPWTVGRRMSTPTVRAFWRNRGKGDSAVV